MKVVIITILEYFMYYTVLSNQPVRSQLIWIKIFLLVCFVALCPKSTAKVMAGRSFHFITLFSEQA